MSERPRPSYRNNGRHYHLGTALNCEECIGSMCQVTSCSGDICYVRAVLEDGQKAPEYDHGCLPLLASKTLCNSNNTLRDHIDKHISRYNCCKIADFCNRGLVVSLPSSVLPATDPVTTITTTTTPTTQGPRVDGWRIAIYTAVAIASTVIVILAVVLFLELIYCRHKLVKLRSRTTASEHQLQLSTSTSSTQVEDYSEEKTDHHKIIA